MNKVSLKLNERTNSIPVFNTVNKILDEYYKSYPIENDDEYGLLYDTYSLINEFFDIIGCKYDKNTKLLLANYIYRSKGSINSIYELFRILWGDNSDTIDGTPNYTIDLNYKVRGYNQLYKKPNEDLLFSEGFTINASNESPLNIHFPLITSNGVKLKLYLLNSAIKDFITIKQIISDPSEIISESVEEKPEWVTNDNLVETTTTYSGEFSFENTFFLTEFDDNDKPITKQQIDSLTFKIGSNSKTFYKSGKTIKIGTKRDISDKSEEPISKGDGYEYIKTDVIESIQPDGTTITTTIITTENTTEKKRKDLYSVSKGPGTSMEYWTETYSYEVTDYKDDELDLSTLKELLPEGQDFFYNEIISKTYEFPYEDLFYKEKDGKYERGREPTDEEIETVVSTELYNDGSLKIKNTIQQANNYIYKETEIKTISITGTGSDSSIFERIVEKISRTIEREYNVQLPKKIIFAKGLNLVQTVTLLDGGLSKCFYDSDNNFKIDKKEINYTPQNKDNEGNDIFTTIDFDNLFSLKDLHTENSGKISYYLSSKIEASDTAESLNAQKYYWYFKEEDFKKIQLKESLDENNNYEVEVLNSNINQSENDTDVKKNDSRPHIEIKLSELESSINSDVIVYNFSKNTNYLDARELIVTISNITVIDKKHFTNVLEELIRDLLLISDRSTNGENSISIKINLTTYNIDSKISLKSENSVRQVNNIIPNSYILQGKLIWTSPYIKTN